MDPKYSPRKDNGVDWTYVKRWATLLFETFCKDGAPHQISDCSSEDRTKIALGVQAQQPSWSVFLNVQSLTFRSLKFTWYPQFVRCKGYAYMLRAAEEAIKAPTRHERLSKYLEPSHGCERSEYSLENPDTGTARQTKHTILGRIGNVFRRGVSKQKTLDHLANNADRDSSAEMSMELNVPWRRGEYMAIVDKKDSAAAKRKRTAFDEWITREWWEHIDVRDMWSDVNSNAELEKALMKMMPTWMPVNESAIFGLLESVHVRGTEKCIESISECNKLVASLRVLTKSHLTAENLENRLRQFKESYPGSETAMRLQPSKEFVFRNILADTPYSAFSKSAQYIHPASLGLNMRGVIVYYCNLICRSYRTRQDLSLSSSPIRENFGFMSGLTYTASRKSSVSTEESVLVPNFFASNQRYVKYLSSMPTQNETLIQSPIHSEKYASQYSDTFSPDGSKRICVLTETALKEGLLYLLDVSDRDKESADVRSISCIVNINTLTRLAPSQTMFSAVDLFDSTGLVWQLHPEGVDDDDASNAAARLLHFISSYASPSAVVIRVIKQGFLKKRGTINRAFQSRWFVLTSDLKLHYYKFETGQRQGTIDIAGVAKVSYSQVWSDTNFALVDMDRTWNLLAETDREKMQWVDCIIQLLEENGWVEREILKGDPV